MNYRTFTALARRVRAESAPDVLTERASATEEQTSRLPAGKIVRMRWGAAAVAAVACVAVAVGAILGGIRPTNPPPLGTESSQPTSSSGEGTQPTGSIAVTMKAPS